MAIKSVVRHVKFPPNQIGQLYLDDADYTGLIYWYNDAKDYAQQIKDSISGKK